MQRDSSGYRHRKGVLPVSWQDFHGLCKALAVAIAPYHPELVLPIARGGFYPGTLITHMLQTEIYPVRVTRRIRDVVKYTKPRWLVEPPPLVAGKRVLVVDEICNSGETLGMVVDKVEALGASAVRSAVLYAHSAGANIPDYIGWVTDSLLLNPWDREVLVDGEFIFAPEYVRALKYQQVEPDSAYLVAAPMVVLARKWKPDPSSDPG